MAHRSQPPAKGSKSWKYTCFFWSFSISAETWSSPVLLSLILSLGILDILCRIREAKVSFTNQVNGCRRVHIVSSFSAVVSHVASTTQMASRWWKEKTLDNKHDGLSQLSRTQQELSCWGRRSRTKYNFLKPSNTERSGYYVEGNFNPIGSTTRGPF